MNLDLPRDSETYMHRIGRTGRFGTYGVAVSFVSPSEKKVLENFEETYSTTILQLPEVILPQFYAHHLTEEDEEKIKLQKRGLSNFSESRRKKQKTE